MRLIQLTSVPNPDIDAGKSSPVLVDAERVVYVERSLRFSPRAGAHEEYTALCGSLFDELGRVEGLVKQTELKLINMEAENTVVHRNWHTIAGAAADLKVAYNMLNSVRGPWNHPPQVCTTIGLGYGNDSGSGALARLHVAETVDEVHEKLGRYLLPDH